MYAVSSAGPSKNDLDAKYLKSYEAFYGVKDDFTEYFDGLFDHRLDGPPINVCEEDAFNTSQTKLDAKWFEAGLPGKLPILCPGLVHGDVSELNKKHQELSLFSTDSSGKKFDKNVYVSIQPKVVSIANMVETEDEYDLLNKGLNLIQQQLLKKKALPTDKVNTSDRAGMVSLPEFDTRPFDTRIKPLMSPEKKQKKRK